MGSGDMKMGRKKSITTEFFKIFIMILGSVAIALGLFFFIGVLEKRLYREMSEKNAYANNVYVELGEMERQIDSYSKTLEGKYLESYLAHSQKLDGFLTELSIIPGQSQIVRDEIRRISSFNDYQLRIWKSNADISLFQVMSYVKMGLSDQKLEAQNLLIHNSEATTREYMSQMKRLDKTKLIIWWSIVAILACSVFIMIKRLKRVVSVLSENQIIAKALTAHQWEVPDACTGYYVELDELSGAINQMKAEIKLYVEQIKEKSRLEIQLKEERLKREQEEKMLVEASLSNLRAQVNPHFLFNALNLIGKTAFLECPETAMELIEAISKILRYSLEKSSGMVPLAREMEIVQAYMFLQETRYGGNMTFTCDIPSLAEDVKIPPMIIQPIIENSFKHGFKQKDIVHISVRAHMTEDYLALYIEDDGEGFDVSALGHMERDGIGVRNVEQRLKLIYGQEGLFKIESQLGNYTKVIIKVPRGGSYETGNS